MPHRDDLEAAHARIAALERELAAARKLRCARCRGAFAPEDLDRTSGELTCRTCRTGVDVRRAPDPPRDLEVSETPERLRIAWRWKLSLGEVWGAIMFLGLPLVVLIGARDREPVIMVSMILLGLLGLFFLYRVVAKIMNRTEIRVTDRQLEIETGPVALDGLKSFADREVEQLYCVMSKGKYAVWYDLYAELASGARLCLVSAIADAERAFYLEREIERRLGVADRPVEGEVPRRG